MDKAFDAILQLEVDAKVITKISHYSNNDRFRYQCLCCGEEVYLAAVNSNERTPHFRHRRGNNDKNCEQYLGQIGAVSHCGLNKKNTQEHIGFYFNKERMTFEISVTFSEKELIFYEKNKTRMTISTKTYADPFWSIPVDKSNFAPETKQYFVLKKFSNVYWVSLSANKKKYPYLDVIKRNGRLNIYKIRLQDERAKLNESNLLYTGIPYIAISDNENVIKELMGLDKSLYVEDKFKFFTMGICFYGIPFFIKNDDYLTKLFFKKNDYQIEISESLNFLWPPVYTVESDFVCNDDRIYVCSSFKLVSHGNTNIEDDMIQKIDDNILEISINDLIIIYEKNINISIKKYDIQSDAPLYINPDTIYMNKYIVQDAYDYFLFDKDGCKRLTAGAIIYLSGKDKIVGYKNGIIREIILGHPMEKEDSEKMIAEILQYHPQSEKYNPDEFIDIIPNEAVLSYLESCYRNGRINTVIKRYIKEGLI